MTRDILNQIPGNIKILSTKLINTDGDNKVYKCSAKIDNKIKEIYIKYNQVNSEFLNNEISILDKLSNSKIKIPKLIFYGRNFIIIESVKGNSILNLIDRNRDSYDERNRLLFLNLYGKALSEIHSINISHSLQKRIKLYGFVNKDEENDPEFKKISHWINEHKPILEFNTFTHGDFNTANIFFLKKKLSGIIDWEYSGYGLKEFDLAWILRARFLFLNTKLEYDTIINGYKEKGSFNKDTLKWCEVLIYFHFAYWCRKEDIKYRQFAKNKIYNIIENSNGT